MKHKQPVKLDGPGASLEEVATALGVTRERQAEIRQILGLRPRETSSQRGPGYTIAPKKRRLAEPSTRRQPV